jgi:hypothetical protein
VRRRRLDKIEDLLPDLPPYSDYAGDDLHEAMRIHSADFDARLAIVKENGFSALDLLIAEHRSIHPYTDRKRS